MKTTLTDRKRKILRRVYGALSLTTALFVFQACYGTRMDMDRDFNIEGKVTSKATGSPIMGIKVSIYNQTGVTVTDNKGEFSIYTLRSAEYKLLFQDIDSVTNGNYREMDTIIPDSSAYRYLIVSLDAK